MNVNNQELYKQCPICKTIVEKDDLSNIRKCINCENSFCWICLQNYEKNHYSIYNFYGCPGLEYSKY